MATHPYSDNDTQLVVDNGETKILVKHDTKPLQEGVPPYLKFVMSEGIATFEFLFNQPIIIGRHYSSGRVTLDLSPYNAIDLGISRQHVKIESFGDMVVVRDLDAVNGSCLNSQVMTPGQAYELQHGDEIKLGRLKVRVFFVYIEIND